MAYMLRSTALTNYIEIARSVGLDPYKELAEAGISRYALLDPEMKIPVDSVVRLLEASAEAADIDDLGLRMAETRQLSNMGPLAFAVREEPTLRKALESMVRYLHLQNEALLIRIDEAEGLVIISEEIQAAGTRRQAIELAVGVLYRTISLFLGAAWRPRSICFMHAAPRNLAICTRVFGMPAQFNQDFDGIVCRASDLEQSLPTYDPAMAHQVRQYLDTLLVQSGTTMPDQVRKLVFALLPAGVCSLERIAMHLGVDRRTVHRRLGDYGESYSSILNAVRVDMVMRYIENRERPLSDVATLLGFSSSSTFSHWFGREFGCSVSKWRAREAKAAEDLSSS
ncbi:AraC family transcriptional regulator [Paraburkholderia sp. CNPSo 3281]|uniref:AraC family transcriptional regulator n=1 Tax=Paraburkholderia sp. CNPSo 3281 TaxID=2940933 RepID=UPI0020B67675|nr:AraC family transcriptional regulator [Paraburkholderia sp. CNPSo 3281]MCP3719972.1 AraC family transcriptional regulator [Paraburkholderia sp. CNPSo 3281]